MSASSVDSGSEKSLLFSRWMEVASQRIVIYKMDTKCGSKRAQTHKTRKTATYCVPAISSPSERSFRMFFSFRFLFNLHCSHLGRNSFSSEPSSSSSYYSEQCTDEHGLCPKKSTTVFSLISILSAHWSRVFHLVRFSDVSFSATTIMEETKIEEK